MYKLFFSRSLQAILDELKLDPPKKTNQEKIQKQIQNDKAAYLTEWKKHITDRVNPALFFESLRKNLSNDAITVVDDGNHTFLAAELFQNYHSKHFISPTDFNCMGYCVPAAIGAKLANPKKQVVGDGGFIMTGMEILTASTENIGIVYFVFYDGELS
ncbi:MAG: acetolactate synthase-1/2/3 large subunit [bacterium]